MLRTWAAVGQQRGVRTAYRQLVWSGRGKCGGRKLSCAGGNAGSEKGVSTPEFLLPTCNGGCESIQVGIADGHSDTFPLERRNEPTTVVLHKRAVSALDGIEMSNALVRVY